MWLDLGDYRGPSHFHAFVRYGLARTRQRAVTRSYRAYVTDSLQLAPQGKVLGRRWLDLVEPRAEIDVEATIEHVMAAMGE